ncbi:hypothetical protein HBI52_077580 [Parastagonospora nodorum]|nr:hypothetical protein HBI09_054520 [Parastagonospora nodorum]KAH4856578.1 hypothetical protein HBH75_074420 [Parastagonospora nodorum]KAH5001148.1 hypothetical protein HBI77_150680 [Parastagonospora nodorum]KAH5042222.1 hypothetical protein HBI75_036710 [Parastagonospora nodorum]KAH5099656.1 hypothetical protein HBH72_109080 [Parastagonospora nodorum]
MSTPTPPGTIIEGLKQGNAVELELVKKMKEGLDSVTEGLMLECYNRSDALSELRESLPTIDASANAMRITNTKTKVGNLDRQMILAAEKMKVEALKACKLANRDSDDAYQNDIARHQKATDRNSARGERLKNTADLLNELFEQSKPKSETMPPVWARLLGEYEASLVAYHEDVDALKEELRQIGARANNRTKNGQELYGRVLSDARETREIWGKLLGCANEVHSG